MKNFGTFDIEANNWIEFLIMGAFDGIQYVEFKKGPEEFIKYMETSPIEYWFAHNGGGYDFLFVLDHLVFNRSDYSTDMVFRGGSTMLCLDITFKKSGKKVTLSDSYALLSFSLEKITKDFGVKHLKGKIDFSKKLVINQELREYLKSDCLGLYEVLTKFFSWKQFEGIKPRKTIGSYALEVFQKKYSGKQTLKALTDRNEIFCRKAYFGGRVEIFRPILFAEEKKTLNYYDINSLFPTAMAENDFYDAPSHISKTMRPGVFGIYRALVKVPEDLFIPSLPVSTDQGIIYPTGIFEGTWTSIDLEYAKTLGTKILDIRYGLVFEKKASKPFKKYVDDFYAIRQNSPKNSVDNITAKLLLNSLYGKFAFKRDREDVIFDDGRVGARPISEVFKLGGKNVRFATVPKYVHGFSNIAVAAQILSHARQIHHKILIAQQKTLYYGDTDSIFTTGTLKTGPGLGQLKLEQEYKEACFLLPKTYMGVSKTGEKTVVMKGFQKKRVKDLFIFHDFAETFFSQINHDKSKNRDARWLTYREQATITRFKSAIKKGKILAVTPEKMKSIRSNYTKRTIDLDNQGWITRPLILREN